VLGAGVVGCCTTTGDEAGAAAAVCGGTLFTLHALSKTSIAADKPIVGK
jgi:hypothetical protein